MEIGIIGYGRMGHEIEKLCPLLKHEIRIQLDIDNPLKPSTDLRGAEVLIDFSIADAVMDTLRATAEIGVPIVEGTTGWFAQLDQARAVKDLTMVYSPNFSMGVYRFIKLVKYASELYGTSKDYDLYVHEWHHSGKKDSPSGTALKLAETILGVVPDKKSWLLTSADGKIPQDVLHVTSTRVGRVPGTHEVGFDSDFDAVTIKHQAHGREGFAYGALRAAEWIADRKGIFTMDDFMSA